MSRWFCPALVSLLFVATGCGVTDPRPVYHTSTVATEGAPVLVVGVEREPDNAPTVRALARELAFALGQRGRAALDLTTFVEQARHRGAPLPSTLVGRLAAGVVDPDTLVWLQAEGVGSLILLDAALYEQVWGPRGKRTRVGLTARGRQLDGTEGTWRAYTTPEVEDEPGQGFQIATEAALAALVRVIVGEAEPALPRAGRLLPRLRPGW